MLATPKTPFLGIDIGKNSFHLVALNKRGAIILRLRLSRTQLEATCQPAALPRRHGSLCRRPSPEAPPQSAGARSEADTGQVRAFLKGNKDDFRDAEAIAEAVQRPTMPFVASKTAEQLDLQALHRVRSRLVSERTATINEVRAFLLDRGVPVAPRIGSDYAI